MLREYLVFMSLQLLFHMPDHGGLGEMDRDGLKGPISDLLTFEQAISCSELDVSSKLIEDEFSRLQTSITLLVVLFMVDADVIEGLGP